MGIGDNEYQRLVTLLDALIDRVGEDEQHPLASLMEVVGALIERYEDEHIPELEGAQDGSTAQNRESRGGR